jgi:hypothetical protein
VPVLSRSLSPDAAVEFVQEGLAAQNSTPLPALPPLIENVRQIEHVSLAFPIVFRFLVALLSCPGRLRGRGRSSGSAVMVEETFGWGWLMRVEGRGSKVLASMACACSLLTGGTGVHGF